MKRDDTELLREALALPAEDRAAALAIENAMPAIVALGGQRNLKTLLKEDRRAASDPSG